MQGASTPPCFHCVPQFPRAQKHWVLRFRHDKSFLLLSLVDHPDAGTTQYEYDPAGNITKETNPLGEIFYDYEYYRPIYKRYSYMTGNDVTYEYGTSGNDKSRLVFVTDGSGSHECHYDALGNVTDEIRTISKTGYRLEERRK